MSNELPSEPKKKPWLVLGVAALAVAAGGGFFLMPKGEAKPKPRKPESIVVTLAPPPPLPPPPPPKVEPPKQEEVKQEMVKQEAVEDTPPPPQATPDEPAPALSTNLEGPGNDNFGLSHGTGKGAIGNGGTGIGGGGRRGGKYDAYAGQTQSAVRDALLRDPKTRTATFSGNFRVWVDATGRITRAKGADGAATTVLNGLQLASAPPSDMPMPIVMRITATKPATASR